MDFAFTAKKDSTIKNNRFVKNELTDRGTAGRAVRCIISKSGEIHVHSFLNSLKGHQGIPPGGKDKVNTWISIG
jgi:hypothetical protein